MAKYLDCDKLIEEIREYKGDNEYYDDGIETAISVCAVFPAANVMEVDCQPQKEQLSYWRNICELNARQEGKGLEKYGEPLEANMTLTTVQRIEHAQEEAIDLLKYLEHLKKVANDGITANDYQRAALRTAPKDGDRLLQGVVGLGGEAGEVLNLYEKHKCQGHELDVEKFVDELSDIAWYLAIAADAVGVKLGDVFKHNKEKLEKRFPQGFSKERSINREQ